MVPVPVPVTPDTYVRISAIFCVCAMFFGNLLAFASMHRHTRTYQYSVRYVGSVPYVYLHAHTYVRTFLHRRYRSYVPAVYVRLLLLFLHAVVVGKPRNPLVLLDETMAVMDDILASSVPVFAAIGVLVAASFVLKVCLFVLHCFCWI